MESSTRMELNVLKTCRLPRHLNRKKTEMSSAADGFTMTLPHPLPGAPPHPSQAPGSLTTSGKQNGKVICSFAALPAAQAVLPLPTSPQEQGVKEFVVSQGDATGGSKLLLQVLSDAQVSEHYLPPDGFQKQSIQI